MKPPRLSVIEGGDPLRRQAAAWFARLHADDVAERDRQAWRQWMAEDARHRAAYERIERLWSAAGEHAQHPQIAERLRDSVSPPMPAPEPSPASTPARPARKRARYVWAATAVAAVIALVAIVPRLGQPPATETLYVTGIGESRTIALDDGSRVSMDTDSRLRVDFSDGQRRLTLVRGRAYFRVASESRPFLVNTESGSVRAVGTEFDVYRRDDAIEVTLVEGRVALLTPPSAHAKQLTVGVLDAGQKARFGKRQPLRRLPPQAPGTPPTWLSGKLVFEDQALDQAAAEFNRYSRKRLLLDGAPVARMRVSGVFRSDDPHAFVEALQALYPVAVRESPAGDLLIVERR
ncbi:FecR family protein [Lysobacter sp. CA199]|uniref:FecR family protein n=1 Tax=Lysobacter sp. CA199 TaxID=3455608 RepID=UPI003F8D7BC9